MQLHDKVLPLAFLLLYFGRPGLSQSYCSDFSIQLNASVVTIPCHLQLYDSLDISVKASCGQALKSCDLNVYFANGTDPDNSIGGPGDTYESGLYVPCPPSEVPGEDALNNGTVTICLQKEVPGSASVNLPFFHVLTTQFVALDNVTNDIFLAPQAIHFDPPTPNPFFFVPSPDGLNEFINQFYSVRCIDTHDRWSNTAYFQLVYPFCP